MAVQHKINLSIADRVVNRALICFRDFADLYHFALLCVFLEGRENRYFFLYTHIAMNAAVMIAGNCFKTVIPIFCYKACHRHGMRKMKQRHPTDFRSKNRQGATYSTKMWADQKPAHTF